MDSNTYPQVTRWAYFDDDVRPAVVYVGDQVSGSDQRT